MSDESLARQTVFAERIPDSIMKWWRGRHFSVDFMTLVERGLDELEDHLDVLDGVTIADSFDDAGFYVTFTWDNGEFAGEATYRIGQETTYFVTDTKPVSLNQFIGRLGEFAP